MEANNNAVTTATNRNILLGILTKKTSKTATATKAGIAYSTFNKKISGDGDFTLHQLGRIAAALDLTLGDILPTELLNKDVA